MAWRHDAIGHLWLRKMTRRARHGRACQCSVVFCSFHSECGQAVSLYPCCIQGESVIQISNHVSPRTTSSRELPEYVMPGSDDVQG